MKNLFTLHILAAIAMLALAPPLRAQVTPVETETLTVPATVAANTTTNVAQVIEVRQGLPMLFMPAFASSNVSESVIYTFQGSVDGTTYTSDTITKTNSFTSNTAIVGWHTFTRDELAGLRYLRLYSIKTGTTGNITNSTYRIAWPGK